MRGKGEVVVEHVYVIIDFVSVEKVHKNSSK